jgi:tyrosine-protein phosphatase YwqE
MFKAFLENFFSSSQKPVGLLHTTDIHSHLIPGIDDGVKDLEESVAIISALQQQGFKKIITTPHIMSHRFPNRAKNIKKEALKVQEELQKRQIDIKFEVAAEYYYDEHFVELIDQQELMSFGDNYVLFELSYTLKPFALEQSVAKLLNAGYKPVLAHPERYSYYKTKDTYEQVKDMGLLFQINAISMTGFYGKSVKKSVDMLIEMGIVDFVGSDIHSKKYLEAFSRSLDSKSYEKLMQNNPVKNDLL